MELPEGEIYRRIGRNADGMPDDEPTITIVGRNAIATSSTIFYNRRIPEGGFVFDDMMMMASRLRVRFTWLADQLDRPEFAGVAGPLVSELAILYRVDVNAPANETIVNNAVERIYRNININRHAAPFIPALHLLTNPVPGDEICVICLGTGAESSGDWATAQGCDRHSFHFACITLWRGNTCMVCRRQLSARE